MKYKHIVYIFQLYNYANYANMQVHYYAIMQVRNYAIYASKQVCKYAIMQVCNYAIYASYANYALKRFPRQFATLKSNYKSIETR